MPNQSKRDEMRAASDRPRVGPADPAVQRQKLAEYEAGAKRESQAKLYQGSQAPARRPPSDDASGIMGRQKRAQIDQIVDKAEKE